VGYACPYWGFILILQAILKNKHMKIIVLGTGTSTGVPMIGCTCAVCQSDDPHDKRLRSSVYIETDNMRICIDTGPDFRQQMLQNQLTQLDAILFTHAHQDHVAGLDDTRPYMIWQQKPLRLYADLQVQSSLKHMFYYAFDPQFKYPGAPEFDVYTISPEQNFRIGNTEIIPIPITHGNLPILGFRIGDFTYITDASHIDEMAQSKIKGTKILIINALQHTPHWSHFSLSQALAMVDTLQPQQTYLTHLSHKIGKHADLEAQLPKGVKVAYDGLTIEL
jgi:phosphoribosyl 1,2-cyclic phosphate phosphodiesterase